MKKQIHQLVGYLIGIMIFACIVPVQSEEVGRGGYAGSYLRMGLGARALAMGGSAVSLADDGYAAYYNPAALAFLENRWVTATLNNMALDRQIAYLGFATSLGKHTEEEMKPGMMQAGFAIGWLSAGVDNIDSRGYDGEDLGTLSTSEHCFYFSFAMKPGPKVAIGFSGKLLYHRFPGIKDDGGALSATGFGFDMAMLVRPIEPLSIGLSVRDIWSKYTWDSQDLYEQGTQTVDEFLKVVQAGASWRTWQNRLLISADIEKVEYYPANLLAGIELNAMENVYLRGGFRKDSPTFGLGYLLNARGHFFKLEYAYASDPVAPSANHIMTWSYRF